MMNLACLLLLVKVLRFVVEKGLCAAFIVLGVMVCLFGRCVVWEDYLLMFVEGNYDYFLMSGRFGLDLDIRIVFFDDLFYPRFHSIYYSLEKRVRMIYLWLLYKKVKMNSYSYYSSILHYRRIYSDDIIFDWLNHYFIVHISVDEYHWIAGHHYLCHVDQKQGLFCKKEKNEANVL